MNEHVHIHHFYSSALIRSLRLVLLFFLFVWTVNDYTNGQIPKYPLFIMSWLLILDVFFHFSLGRIPPRLPLQENDGKQPLHSFTHEVVDILLASEATEACVRALMRLPQVRFLMEHLALTENDIPIVSVDRSAWIRLAGETALQVNGVYGTTMDCFAAYLQMTEPKEKLLFAHQLKLTDLYATLSWARERFPQEEKPVKPVVEIQGNGIGEALTTGWTPETKQYTVDFTSESFLQSRSIVGRENEYTQMLNALAVSDTKNVLLIGEAGIGKETLVAAFAAASFSGQVPNALQHKRLITLMVGPLLAGVQGRSDLETRLQAIVAELSHAGNIILYIPEIQEILGESSYSVNLSGALLPYLKKGSLPIIATMTPENYKAYMEKNGLKEVFTEITLKEPEADSALRMLFVRTPEIERHAKVIIPYASVKEAIRLAPKYLPDAVLPGSAVRLLSDAAQNPKNGGADQKRPVILPEALVMTVEEKVHAPVAAPKKAEKELLLHLEKKLHERVIGQEQAITHLAEAIRRMRTGMTKNTKPISFLFLGPTGVGKTETAKALAEIYFGGEDKMLRLDMSEYVDAAGVLRLLGAPPGSGDERGELTDKIHDNPYSLVLLDEFEKAHPKILDLFLQVLSDGRLTDNKGKTVSFSDSIIIATSNAASEFVRESVSQGRKLDKQFQVALLEHLQSEHLFKPELLNRFDGIIVFQPLSASDSEAVTALILADITERMAEQDITVVFDKSVLSQVAKEGTDDQFGARPLKRYIQDTVEDMIARLMLEEKLKRGDTLHIMIDANGKFVATVNEGKAEES